MAHAQKRGRGLPGTARAATGPKASGVCRSLAAAAPSAVAAAALAHCLTMLPGAFAVLLAAFSLAESKNKDFYTFKVVNSRGKLVSLEKYRGSVSLSITV